MSFYPGKLSGAIEAKHAHLIVRTGYRYVKNKFLNSLLSYIGKKEIEILQRFQFRQSSVKNFNLN